MRDPAETDISDEEAEDFARRMISSVEDLDSAGDQDAWNDFVGHKILGDLGYGMTDKQAAVLEQGRLGAYNLTDELSIRREQPFVTRPRQVRYRDLDTGRWLGKADINAQIKQLLRRK